VARQLGDLSVSQLHDLVINLVSASAKTCDMALTYLATVPKTKNTAPPPSSSSSASSAPSAAVVGGAAVAGGATAGAVAATYQMQDRSDGAEASAPPPSAPPPEAGKKKKKRGFMSSLSNTFNDMKKSASVATAKMGVAMGITYNSKKFRESFDLAPDQPLLAEEQCVLLNGAFRLSGQMYVTPSLLCVYTVTANKEVKVKIELATVTHIAERTCPNYKEKKEEPVIIDTPAGSRPNVLQIYCNDGFIHTLILDPTKMDPLNTWLHMNWDRSVANGQVTLPVPTAPTPVHTAFNLHQSEPLLGVAKASIINGTDLISVNFHVFLHQFGFEVGGSPVLIPFANVSNLVAARATKMAGSPIPILAPAASTSEPNALQIYTTDGCVHQLCKISGDVYKLHSQLTYAWALNTGSPPQYCA